MAQAAPPPDPAQAERLRLAGVGMTISIHAAESPERPAIISEYGDRNFGQLNARANQVARALRQCGLAEGDAVALLCRNRPEFAEVWAATQRAGLRLT
ncbi:MAG: AMP-binding protein, partial [Acidimicrobiia bacterium]